jgi:FKBP-type peptidyl-prolyl cis-trans isomerase
MNIKPGIKLVEESEGTGEKANRGDVVRVRLNGWLSKGKQIQSNYIENVLLGNRNLIPGIEYSIEGMRTSGIRKVKISPHLGYGAKGVVNLIPPNAVLIYEIEVLDIESGA